MWWVIAAVLIFDVVTTLFLIYKWATRNRPPKWVRDAMNKPMPTLEEIVARTPGLEIVYKDKEGDNVE